MVAAVRLAGRAGSDGCDYNSGGNACRERGGSCKGTAALMPLLSLSSPPSLCCPRAQHSHQHSQGHTENGAPSLFMEQSGEKATAGIVLRSTSTIKLCCALCHPPQSCTWPPVFASSAGTACPFGFITST